jgi:hypothetical protein
MAKRDDGGAAFPVDLGDRIWEGMSLRSFYKGMALQGFLSTLTEKQTEDYLMDNEDDLKVCKEHWDSVAKWVAGYADAMIAEDKEAAGEAK